MAGYKLVKNNGEIEVWTTGKHNNEIEYKGGDDLSNFRRKRLAFIQDFLIEAGEIAEANRIGDYLGKMIRTNSIPKLIPTGNYDIHVSLDYLKRQIDVYLDEDGLDLNPDFQRCHVWTREQQINFVEFILQDGKCPPIYFNQPEWSGSNMVIVDGKQRLTALLSFLNNEFTVFKNLDDEGIGFYAKEFDYFGNGVNIAVNDLPTKKQVLQWYLQINKGQVAHTSDEIGKVEKMLEELDE